MLRFFVSVNATAQEQFGERRIMTEKEYIRFLFRMRVIPSSMECERAIQELKEEYGNGIENVDGSIVQLTRAVDPNTDQKRCGCRKN